MQYMIYIKRLGVSFDRYNKRILLADNPSESEEQLYAELLTTRLTLKDYEEKIRMYELEKLRFIDTISQIVKV